MPFNQWIFGVSGGSILSPPQSRWLHFHNSCAFFVFSVFSTLDLGKLNLDQNLKLCLLCTPDLGQSGFLDFEPRCCWICENWCEYRLMFSKKGGKVEARGTEANPYFGLLFEARRARLLTP